MRCIVRPVVVYLVCVALLVSPTASAFAQTSVVKVAFLGIAFEDVSPEIQKKVSDDLLSLLREERSLLTLTPDEIRERIGEERRAQLVAQMQRSSMLDLAAQLDVDYIFAGRLSNQSKDPNRTLLVGSIQRFDRATRATFSYDILRYAHDLGEDLKKIKHELVVTILPSTSSSLADALPLLIVGGIALLGILALLLSTGKTSGEERTPNEPVTN
jgi:hypothetical protein